MNLWPFFKEKFSQVSGAALLSVAIFSASELVSQSDQYNVASSEFLGTYLQGKIILNDDSVEGIVSSVEGGLGGDMNEAFPVGHPLRNPARRFLTTSVRLPSTDVADGNGGVKNYVVPDLIYKVKSSGDAGSLGARLMPVGSPELTGDVNTVLRKILYGEVTGESDQYIYTMTGHMGGFATGFNDLKTLMRRKIKSDIGHVTAYYADYGFTRRGLEDTTLHAWSPKNMLLVSVQGVPQKATNLNAIIWSMLYYQNPDDYQFADDYSFDYVVNYNLEETLAFATGWLDHSWVRKDLVQRIYNTYQENGEHKRESILNEPYYEMLQYDSEFGLYCYEGVTNTLNIALNVPLTLNWFKRIWGEERGTQMFAKAEERWQEVQEYYNEFNGGQIEVTTLAQHEALLSQITPLWVDDVPVDSGKPLFPERAYDGTVENSEYEDALRDSKMREAGLALSYKPQTASEILRDFIVQYVPFHKAGGINTALAIMGFYDKIHSRTGVDQATYYGFAIPLVAQMFAFEMGYIQEKYTGNQEAQAMYRGATLAKLREKFEDSSLWDNLNASVTQAMDNPVNVPHDGTDPGLAYWEAYYAVAKVQLEGEINFVPVAEEDIILQRIQGNKYVKWNNRPGVLGAISLGIHATHPKVKFTPAVTAVGEGRVERSNFRETYIRSQHQELLDFTTGSSH